MNDITITFRGKVTETELSTKSTLICDKYHDYEDLKMHTEIRNILTTPMNNFQV